VNKEKILKLLEQKLVVARGCTEPIAIAYASAVARKQLKVLPEKIIVKLSGNMVKNAMVVSIPGTSYTGIDFVAALGAISGKPEKHLEVIGGLKSEDFEKAVRMVNTGAVEVELSDSTERLYIEVILENQDDKSRVIIMKNHLNIVLIEHNGKVIMKKEGQGDKVAIGDEDWSSLDIDTIYEFCQECELTKLGIVKYSITMNTQISDWGLKESCGLEVGKTMMTNIEKGIVKDDLPNCLMAVTGAASDARMAGVDLPVMSNSGSGNQGIAATMPVVEAAKKFGSTEEELLRAVTLSHLITIHIKLKFGVLSALCGAVVAAAGAASGIVYLMDGNIQQIRYGIQNTLGNVAGILCDGAKADCSLKISTCTNAAVQGALLAMQNISISGKEGFVDGDVEKTIENFSRLSKEGSIVMDKILLEIMLSKKKAV